MRLWKVVIAACFIAAGSAAIGWKASKIRETRSCEYFKNIPKFEGYVSRLPRYDRAVPPAVIARVYDCWAQSDYIDIEAARWLKWTPVLLLRDVRRANSASYFLVFEKSGVRDSPLIVQIGEKGEAEQAFSYPYSIT